MAKIVLFTDSSCDVEKEVLDSWKVKEIQLRVLLDDEEFAFESGEDTKAFYEKLRQGSTAKTSAANSQACIDAFEPELEAGRDIIYLGFSSALSTNYNQARNAACELSEKYPDRKIAVIDSLCASLGHGLLLRLSVLRRDSGASFDELVNYIEEVKKKICHWFIVDDLGFLKRGGRISSAAALFGSALSIKPVMHVDDNGCLVKKSQARGRKAAIKEMLDRYESTAIASGKMPVFISHGDCIDDALEVERQLKENYGVEETYINYVGPVIGAHSGPGTLSIFFVGSER